MTNRELARSYLYDAEKCLELAAHGDAFQIGAARYKISEAIDLLNQPPERTASPRSAGDQPNG